MKTQILGLLAAAALAGPLTAAAAPLVVTDQPPSGGGANIGTLDVGLNTVSGSVDDGTCFLGDRFVQCTPRPAFSVSLPDALELVSIELLISNLEGVFNLVAESAGSTAYSLALTANGVFALWAGSVTGPTDVRVDFEGGSAGVEGNYSYDYEYRFSVRSMAVPEPGTFALLGLGLAGLTFGARRRRGEQ